MIDTNLLNKIDSLAKSLGLEIYDIALLKENDDDILRINISKNFPTPKERSVGIEDCKQFSMMLSPLLDVELNAIDKYTLEISSPGLERSIKTRRQFELSLGEQISVKLYDKSTISGILNAIDNEKIIVDTQEIKYDSIKKAKTVFEF